MKQLKLRLAALAMVALIGAGCGSDAPTETGSSGAAGTPTVDAQPETFAGCMRKHGVKKFPDQNGLSDQEFVEAIERTDPDSAAFKQALRACKDLQPPGLLGGKASPKQMSARLEFAACIRRNGVKDFPDPANDAPLVNTNLIPSTNTPGGMDILHAAMKTCGAEAEKAIGSKP